MGRQLLTDVLDGFARDAARQWQMPDVESPITPGLYRSGPGWVLQSMYNFHFKDEFDRVLSVLPDELPSRMRDDFMARAKERFSPRSDKVWEEQLRERLAQSPGGDHIDGAIGLVEIGRRVVGRRAVVKRKPIVRPKIKGRPDGEWEIVGYREYAKLIRDEWPIYEGEGEERIAGNIRKEIGVGKGADPLPEGTEGLPLGANVPNFSAESVIGMLDFIDTSVNEGSTAATLRHRTGAQPADPDATETGTLLGTNTMADPAFGAAADDGDGTCSLTAAAITDDSSADATGTAAYFRIGATGTGADDHVDGTIGTSGADLNMNTVSYVSGSTISITSLVIGMSQGSTAT